MQAAHAAARTNQAYLRSLYYRVAARRGKARVAVGRTILQAAYHMLTRGVPYQELEANYLDQLDRERTAKRLLKRLQALGFEVTVLINLALPLSVLEPTPGAAFTSI